MKGNKLSKKEYFKFESTSSKGTLHKLKEYKSVVVGNRSWVFWIYFELMQLTVIPIPGLLGVVLRSIFCRFLFSHFGKGVYLGRNVSLRHPHKIRLKSGCIIDENVLLDAKGGQNEGIDVGESVFVGRNSILSCKNGNITLCNRSNIGFNCEIFSSSSVSIGEDCIVAAYCYVVGGGSYQMDLSALPMAQFPDFEGKGGICIEEGVWLGAHVVVLDGVSIGKHSAVAAGAVVNRTLESFGVYGGVPAKLIGSRKEK